MEVVDDLVVANHYLDPQNAQTIRFLTHNNFRLLHLPFHSVIQSIHLVAKRHATPSSDQTNDIPNHRQFANSDFGAE